MSSPDARVASTDRRWHHRRLGPALTAVVALALLLVGLGTPAQADPLPGVITNVTLSDTTVSNHQVLKVNLDWKAPANAKPNDTFTLTLPPEFTPMTSTFNLKDPEGEVVATATVAGGVVTFTLTNYVASHDNVGGTAYFWARFNTDKQTGETMTLEFGSQESVSKIKVPVTIDNGSGELTKTAAKWGTWVDPAKQDMIEWHLWSPVGPWNSVTVTDTIDPGQSLDCSTLAYNTWFEPDPAQDITGPVDVSCTPAGFRITFPPLAEKQRYSIVYRATITDPDRSEYHNSSTWLVDADTQVSPDQPLARYGAGGDGSGNTTTSTTTTVPTTATTAPTTAPTTPTTGATTTSLGSGATTPTSGPPAPGPVTPPPARTGSSLPRTGSDLRTQLALGLALVAAGWTILIVRRRRLNGI